MKKSSIDDLFWAAPAAVAFGILTAAFFVAVVRHNMKLWKGEPPWPTCEDEDD